MWLLLPVLLSLPPVTGAAASHHNCNAPLVAGLPHTSFLSSSQSAPGYAAHYAKLNRRDGAGGWSPLVTDQTPWLQLDLREQMEVTAVATQGRYDSLDWVSRFLLLHSDTGKLWKVYRHEDGVESLVGNVNSEAVVHNKLSHLLRTRFLRFVPLDWNPSGWQGLRVEVYGCSYKSFVADFDGRSALLYRFNQKSTSTVKDVISLRFRSHTAEGVLLHGEGQRGDYITLELHQGRLDLYLNLDEGRGALRRRRASLSAGSLLDDQHWHSVHLERFNRQLNLSVDGVSQQLTCRGEGLSLEVDYELSFGGIPLPGKPGTFLRRNFQGCMENLYYNGINVIDLAKRRKPQIHSVGNVTFSCSQPQVSSWTYLSSSNSYLSIPATALPAGGSFSVRFRFRTWNPSGLLLVLDLDPDPQRLQILLRSSFLHLSVQQRGSRKSQEVSAGQRLDDGLWHSVSLELKDLQLLLTLDGEQSAVIPLWEAVEPRGNIFIGGCPAADCQPQTSSFQGCMTLLFINNLSVNLSLVQQGMLGNYNKLQFDTCSIKDRCLPSLCEHGSRCSQTWTSFYCDCSGTGYSGATCHNSIYESSCESYRVSGSSSGLYFIDPDGSGPLEALQVYCNMTEKKVWTVLSHNVSSPVAVRGSTPDAPHIMTFNYSATATQLRAVVLGAEQCQQEVVYNCWKSRLFNAKDGSPLSYWLDREGERRSYWGGFLPSVQQCSCNLEENCLDRNYFCNCDADIDTWTNDSGILSYKDHLPVSQMVVGDTERSGSQAVYRLGPLRCYGDKSVWNAASFYQESSYLYFPWLQTELTSDLSFYFKTGSPSGVFLENQGLKDFLRLELSSPSVVTFSFDVGNAPVVLWVKSPLPLNDRQWHAVRAERSVKEAWLQVDQLPARLVHAAPDARHKMKLSSQLFVGGSASQQRGFLGCIRSLQVNGVTLDLEERARMTPGVSSGCPGYCSGSISLCHNRGRCLERNNGYTCDCSLSAYGGSTCSQEVSVSFEGDSSVTYTFQEPFSVMQNGSVASSVASGSQSRAREDMTFSFLTLQRPAMLLSLGTFSRQHIAVILARNGTLQIWYHLQTDRSPDVFTPVQTNLADGRLHRVRIHRVGKTLYVQLDQDIHRKFSLSSEAELILIRSLTLGRVSTSEEVFQEEVQQAASRGFVGCLSSVQFNHVAPLKAALTSRGSSLVSIRGPLVQSNCGALAESNTHTQDLPGTQQEEERGGAAQRDLAVIAGVVTAVVFIAVCALAVVSRLLYQQRRAQQDSGGGVAVGGVGVMVGGVGGGGGGLGGGGL